MKNYLIIVILIAILIAALLWINSKKEGWYPSTTYVNTPNNLGVYPMNTDIWWAYNGWDTRPFWNRYYNPVPFTNSLPQPPVPYTPTPGPDVWSPPAYPFTPMLTSIKGYKDYPIGEWVKSGMGYSNQGKYVDVYQLNLDPSRRFYKYMAINDMGQQIPLQIFKNDGVLEDGDRFKVLGNPHEFTFQEADKYMFIYT